MTDTTAIPTIREKIIDLSHELTEHDCRPGCDPSIGHTWFLATVETLTQGLARPLAVVREALEESKRELHRVGACEGGVFDDIELPHSCYFLDAALSLLPEVTK